MQNTGSESMIETLRDICEVLFDSSLEDPSAPLIWLNKLDKELKTDDPLCTKGDNNVDMVIPKLLDVLKECLSSHRWSQVVPVIKQISKHELTTFWKTSMEAMYVSDSAVSLVQQLVKELKTVRHLSCQEVLLEYLMFLLHHGKIDDAKQISQEKVKQTRYEQTARDHHTEVLYKSYLGLVWYVEWKSLKMKIKDLDENSDLVSNYEEIMVVYAQKAMIGFQQVSGEVGVWDIFITKHVEILEHYDKIEEAKDILAQYRDKNTENLNAHKYVYYFCVRNGFFEHDEIQLLMNIAEKCPSDSLVLPLCNKLVEDNKIREALKFLFDLLDYCCWQQQLKAWKFLVDLIAIRNKSSEVIHTLEESWKIRQSWWPQYHFTSYDCPESGEECELCLCKSKYAAYVLGQDFQNIHKDFQHLSKTQIQMLMSSVT
ncbi:TATA box-binding protein-associated factor RNA polymerase I subunit A-like [Mytilus californianus]|uniref:TATA box-binding protein-associated factor RNA polymerase I subunit A-like n=1 Tax=Mytilus californianus TaxID=6549 RepID=UPI0022464C37|nr:TATA box-binding protein-associated factor RNA polymerase I subunit A-like [Mytilus californianus]